MSGRLLTCYAPLRRSPSMDIAVHNAAPRLACVKPAASVHPEPGSNSSLYNSISLFVCPASLTLLALLLFACLYLFPQPFQSTSNIFRFLIPCGPPLSFGDCKGTLFLFLTKFFCGFLHDYLFPGRQSMHLGSIGGESMLLSINCSGSKIERKCRDRRKFHEFCINLLNGSVEVAAYTEKEPVY